MKFNFGARFLMFIVLINLIWNYVVLLLILFQLLIGSHSEFDI